MIVLVNLCAPVDWYWTRSFYCTSICKYRCFCVCWKCVALCVQSIILFRILGIEILQLTNRYVLIKSLLLPNTACASEESHLIKFLICTMCVHRVRDTIKHWFSRTGGGRVKHLFSRIINKQMFFFFWFYFYFYLHFFDVIVRLWVL